jgi:glutathione S-transferase
LAICDYLDRRFPQAGLLPVDSWARAQAISTFAWMNDTVHPNFTHIFRTQKFADDEAAQAEVRRKAKDTFRAQLERIQGMAEKAAPYLLGDKLSFIDAYALVFLRWAGMAGIDPAGLPGYQAYVRNLAESPPVAAAIAREGIKLDTDQPA